MDRNQLYNQSATDAFAIDGASILKVRTEENRHPPPPPPPPPTHTHTRTHTHTHTQPHTHSSTLNHTHPHPRTHTRTHPHTCPYTHTSTHTHPHAHAHMNGWPLDFEDTRLLGNLAILVYRRSLMHSYCFYTTPTKPTCGLYCTYYRAASNFSF